MRRTLLIMRHAKSSWKESRISDVLRPLNGRGKKDAPSMGVRLKRSGYRPDLILSSTAKRALDTAKKVADGLGYTGDIQTDEALYMADIDDYLQVVAAVDDSVKHLMLVSHNPGSEELFTFLTGERVEKFPTAAYALIEIEGSWSAIFGAKLVRFDFPKSS